MKKIIGIIIALIILIILSIGSVIYLLAFSPVSIISITNESVKVETSELTIISTDCCVSGNGCSRGAVHVKIRWDYSSNEKIYGYNGIWEIKLFHNNQTVSHEKMSQPLVANSISDFDFPILSFLPNISDYNITLTEKGENITLQTTCQAR